MDTTRIALEIGGTKLQAALGASRGEILAVERAKAPAGEGAAAILEWFDTAIPALLGANQAQHPPPSGIAIGFGGPVDSAAGVVLRSHQVSGWDGYPLKAHFEERFHLPTAVFNDSNAAGWGEYRLGAGRGVRNFCYMNIGSGIGGALIIDGKLHDGQGLGAGEIGHTYVPDWTASSAGAAAKLENLCSGWAIEKHVRACGAIPVNSLLNELCGGDRNTITCAMLGEAAQQGDEFAKEKLERFAETLGVALANVITLFHPERIAVGGGVSFIGDALFTPLRGAVDRLVFAPFRGRYEITPCALGENVVLAGALLLASE